MSISVYERYRSAFIEGIARVLEFRPPTLSRR